MNKHHFQFSLPDGNIKFKTCTGGFVTIILAFLVLAYAVTQFITLWERSNYSILEKYEEKMLKDGEFVFTKKDGFTIAAAFVGTGDF